MSTRDNSSEEAAAIAVAQVLGASCWHLNDTGSADGQFDICLVTERGSRIALEVTSYGGETWRQTAARIDQQRRMGSCAGEGLGMVWAVVIQTGIGIRELQPALEEALVLLESTGADGIDVVESSTDSPALKTAIEGLRRLGVRSTWVLKENPVADEPRIVLLQSERTIGTAGSLPSGLTCVFARGDNQRKLDVEGYDERHLYVFVLDGGAAAVLQGLWPLPPCPEDPAGVIDTLWVYSPSASTFLFRVTPGTEDWERFVVANGEPWPATG